MIQGSRWGPTCHYLFVELGDTLTCLVFEIGDHRFSILANGRRDHRADRVPPPPGSPNEVHDSLGNMPCRLQAEKVACGKQVISLLQIKRRCDMKFTEKRIVITGGSSGIGRQMARTFGEYEAEVVITGRSRPSLDEAASGQSSRLKWLSRLAPGFIYGQLNKCFTAARRSPP